MRTKSFSGDPICFEEILEVVRSRLTILEKFKDDWINTKTKLVKRDEDLWDKMLALILSGGNKKISPVQKNQIRDLALICVFHTTPWEDPVSEKEKWVMLANRLPVSKTPQNNLFTRISLFDGHRINKRRIPYKPYNRFPFMQVKQMSDAGYSIDHIVETLGVRRGRVKQCLSEKIPGTRETYKQLNKTKVIEAFLSGETADEISARMKMRLSEVANTIDEWTKK